MITHIANNQDALRFSLDTSKKIVERIILEEGQTCDEVSIYFVNTEEISRLHQEYFDDPSPTDCISFPMDEEEDGLSYRVLGDIFICPETAIEYAKSHQLDPYVETTLYIVHGLLHLMGYDDIEEEDITLMRQAEQRHMAKLKKLKLILKKLA